VARKKRLNHRDTETQRRPEERIERGRREDRKSGGDPLL
jgi:hypothetical protein